MKQNFYKTDLGIIIKDSDSIRLKSSYERRKISEDEFNNSNPIKINQQKYLEELNKWFKNTKYSWEYKGTKFKKLDNFEIDNSGKITNYNFNLDIPQHNFESLGKYFIVLHQGRLYYTFIYNNYYPQMQLISFHNKQLTNKWTNIKNLSPVFNCDTKKII